MMLRRRFKLERAEPSEESNVVEILNEFGSEVCLSHGAVMDILNGSYNNPEDIADDQVEKEAVHKYIIGASDAPHSWSSFLQVAENGVARRMYVGEVLTLLNRFHSYKKERMLVDEINQSIADSVKSTADVVSRMPEAPANKYARTIKGITSGSCVVDVYSVIEAFDVRCAARQHALKKILCSGIRGKGNVLQDLKEAIQALERAVQLEQQRQVDNF